MAVNATVFTPRTTQADLTQANTSQVVRVTIPGSSSVGSFAQDRQQEVVRITVPGQQGAQGPSGAAASDMVLGDLNDVDITSPDDGSLIQYNTATERWTDQTDISNLGILTISGGNF